MSAARPQDSDCKALRRRDPEAVEKWFLEHSVAIHAFASRRVGSDLASDAVQETFVLALQRIDEFDPARGAMLPWLLFHARNVMRTTLRRAGRQVEFDRWHGEDRLSELAALRDIESNPLPEDVVDRAETAAFVRAALERLPEHYRRALVRHHVDERKLSDLAHELGITETAMRSLLHRARLAFKDELDALFSPDSSGADRRISS